MNDNSNDAVNQDLILKDGFFYNGGPRRYL